MESLCTKITEVNLSVFVESFIHKDSEKLI